jgi:hypothetical protein
MDTWRRQQRSIETQPVLPFTGEGAYHGSTKPRAPAPPRPKPRPLVDEVLPRTLDAYERTGQTQIDTFLATFSNLYEVAAVLDVPSQEAIRDDGVSLCWCPMALARQQAGPVVRGVLDEMSRHLDGGKRHVYIDAKIQYFRRGDVPVDSHIWHLDGTIVARDERVQRLGHTLLHDMRARLDGPASPPRFLSYQSSLHCATRFATKPVSFELPELIPDFDVLDARVRATDVGAQSQPPGSIVRFDGLSLHRAVVARDDGWRLWVRCVETDREVKLTSQIIDCYATVFRTPPTSASRLASTR